MTPTTYICKAKSPTSHIAVGSLRFTSFTTFYNQDLLIVTNCNPIFLYSNASRSWYRKIRHMKPATSTKSKLLSYSAVGNYNKMSLAVKRLLVSKKSRERNSQRTCTHAPIDLVKSERFYLAFAILSEADELLLEGLLAALQAQNSTSPVSLEIFTQKPTVEVEKILVGKNVDNLRIIRLADKTQ